MTYTVGEMAKKLNIAPSTLRYYDQMGLLPFVERTSGGARVFKESDYEWLQTINCLKSTGMKLSNIKKFVEMAMLGDSTIAPRLELIKQQRAAVQAKIAELGETLKTLDFKQWYYETALKNGTTEIPREMPLEALPEQFKEVRKKLRGE